MIQNRKGRMIQLEKVLQSPGSFVRGGVDIVDFNMWDVNGGTGTSKLAKPK